MIRAFFKLKLRERVVLLGAVILGTAAFVVALFNFLNGTLFGGVKFPKSALRPDGGIQRYVRQTYTELPIEIQFPGTTYGVTIGGTELPPNESCAGFKFSDSIYLIAAELEPGEETSSFVNSNFPAALGVGDNEAQYTVKIHDMGFLNTFPVEYEGGIIKAAGQKLYVLTYKVEIDDYCFLLSAICSDKNQLRAAFTELNHMFYSMCKYGEDYIPPTGQISGNSVVVKANGASSEVVVETPTIELYGDRDYETFEDVMEQKARDDYRLSNPNATQIKESIEVGKPMSSDTVAFTFEYSYGASTPSEAKLYDPSGNEYSPDYYNTEKDGRIVFVVEKPVYGTWTILVSDDIEMGQYEVHALRYMDYMDAVNSTSKPQEYDISEENSQPLVVKEGTVMDQSMGVPMFPEQSAEPEPVDNAGHPIEAN